MLSIDIRYNLNAILWKEVDLTWLQLTAKLERYFVERS